MIPKTNRALIAAQQAAAKKKEPQNRLTAVWNRANEYVKKRDFESAYRLMLHEGDDMYLLRLVV